MRIASSIAGTAVIGAALLIQWHAPAAQAATSYPGFTTSWYITNSTDPTDGYNKGCSLGTAVKAGSKPQLAWVILDFFSQAYVSGKGWGVEYDDRVYRSMATIKAYVTEYAHGYWKCTGSDTTARLYLGMGTRNIFWGSTDTAGAGTVWANAVDSVNANLGLYDTQVNVYGAIDAELGWASPSYTLAWANAYDSAGDWMYADYGDAAGCPPAGTCNGGYTQANVYDLAYGIGAALAFPEIYTATLAKQWASLSLWGYQHRSAAMFITGSFTQQGACAQHNCSTLSPLDAWTDLKNELAKNVNTAPCTPSYASDIKWQ
jgi:hypothetical protein